MAYKETATCWHILTVTEGGKVSILKNLDAPTARQAYKKLDPRSRPERYLNRGASDELMSWSGGWSHGPSDGDIKTVEIIGPEGAELDPWRGVEPIYYDLSANRGFGPERLSPEIGRKLAAEEDAAEQSERTGA